MPLVTPASAHPKPGRPLRVVALLPGIVLGLSLTACVTKSRAQAEARKAFVAGQQEAFMRMQHAQGPSVTISGPVQNSVLPWSAETSLAHALLAAGYQGRADPKEILIVRKGRGIQVDVERLLRGEDVPLEAGDVIYLK